MIELYNSSYSYDLINGLLELGGGAFNMINVYRLYKDKKVHGVSWPIWIWYSVWGIWNLWYYPSLNQHFSFAGGIFIVISNLLWLALAIKYKVWRKLYNTLLRAKKKNKSEGIYIHCGNCGYQFYECDYGKLPQLKCPFCLKVFDNIDL